MPNQPRRTPSYRHYKPKNLGVVRINGHDEYLGPYNSDESWEKYHRLIAEWLGNPQKELCQRKTPSGATTHTRSRN